MTLIGGGGGGQHGTIAATTVARTGGRGGNSAGITNATFLTSMLPSTIYLQVGAGGAGGTTTLGLGGVGTPSSVFADHAGTLIFATALGGTNSTTATAAATLTNMQLVSNAMEWVGYAGVLGGAASAAIGTSVTAITSSILSGGSAGGGVSAVNSPSACGAVTIPATFPFLNTQASQAVAPGGAGQWLWNPMCGTGGQGSPGQPAGCIPGGDGAFGCGGGGAGGGTAASKAGDGGPGLIILNCW